jgi:hypothetical protein
MAEVRRPPIHGPARGHGGWNVPLPLAVPLFILLPIDVVLVALSLVTGDACRPAGSCTSPDRTSWQFGTAGAVAVLAFAGVLVMTARRAHPWWQWLLGAVAIGAAAWPIFWITVLDQPYVIH